MERKRSIGALPMRGEKAPGRWRGSPFSRTAACCYAPDLGARRKRGRRRDAKKNADKGCGIEKPYENLGSKSHKGGKIVPRHQAPCRASVPRRGGRPSIPTPHVTEEDEGSAREVSGTLEPELGGRTDTPRKSSIDLRLWLHEKGDRGQVALAKGKFEVRLGERKILCATTLNPLMQRARVLRPGKVRGS